MIGEGVSTYQSDHVCPVCGGTLTLAMRRGTTAYEYWHLCNSPGSCRFESDPFRCDEPSLEDFSDTVQAEFVYEYGGVPSLDEDYRVNEMAFTVAEREASSRPR